MSAFDPADMSGDPLSMAYRAILDLKM
jgi:hypothetical protein